MTRTRLSDASQYTIRQRARAFISGLPELEPLLNVAREGLRQEGLGQDKRINYALRIAESSSSTCSGISELINTLSAGRRAEPDHAAPYRSPGRSAGILIPIPPNVQDRLCELYRARHDEAMASMLKQEREAGSPENASHISEARIRSKMGKARSAYNLLKGGAIDSPTARRHLAAVFCDGAKDVLTGGLVFTPDAEHIREAIIREFSGEEIRVIIPYGISAYEAGRILSAVSEGLCGADMSFLPPRR